MENLKGKKILITAGPTWVPIDSVRVISNIASGETGILLAEKLQKLGSRVTLALGPVGDCCLNRKIRLIRFKFFDDLKHIIERELRVRKYDIVIHSAAVADYRPKKIRQNKISSERKNFTLNLMPLPKILDAIKKKNVALKVVAFKFEPGAAKSELIKKARVLLRRSGADLAVANTVYHNHYLAYIVNRDKTMGPEFSKIKLVRKLINQIGEITCRKQN